MLIPQVVGFKLTGKLRRGRDRDRPRAHRHADAPQEGRRREVRRVLRPGRRRALARRPRDDREHGARVRRDDRLLPGRRRDARATCASPAATSSRRSSSRPTARSRASSRTTNAPEPRLHRHARARPRRPSSRRSPARSARRTASPLERREGGLPRESLVGDAQAAGRGRGRRSGGEGATRPPVDRQARPVGRRAGRRPTIGHGAVVIAAITSCTNTSNPAVMIAAGLAREEGGRARPRRASRG